jgi:hypothetical protein
MKTFKSLDELAVLKNNSPQYKGKLPNYQQQGSKQNKKKYTQYEQHKFTAYQNILYKRALYGLAMYSQKEQKSLHWKERGKIKRINRKAQQSVNLFKQERVNIMCDNLYKAAFPNSKLAKDVFSLEKSTTNPKFINKLDLKFLRISKEDIIKRFVKEGVLPKNFYELKKAA